MLWLVKALWCERCVCCCWDIAIRDWQDTSCHPEGLAGLISYPILHSIPPPLPNEPSIRSSIAIPRPQYEGDADI